jgi:hypothetical protein
MDSAITFEDDLYSPKIVANNDNRFLVDFDDQHWHQKLSERIQELAALKVGWDGASGQQIPFLTIHFVCHLLDRLLDAQTPSPSLVPTSGGEVQLEWHLPGFDLELLVERPMTSHYWAAYIAEDQSVVEEEGSVRADFTHILALLRKIRI